MAKSGVRVRTVAFCVAVVALTSVSCGADKSGTAAGAPPGALDAVRHLQGVHRIDRSASKTSTWAKYAKATADDDPNPPASFLAKPETLVWVVAATGDFEQIGGSATHATWAVFVLDAQSGTEFARDVGRGSSWPKYFDERL